MTDSENVFCAKLSRTVEGLLFPSESDLPIEIVFDEHSKSADESLSRLFPEGTQISNEVGLEDFYAAYAVPKNWQNDLQKRFAEKFSATLDLLKQNLTDLKVIKVGTIRIELFVIGKTTDGKIAGIRTALIET